jgi:hypothetical protein
MTVTQVLTSQSIGTGSNKGNDLTFSTATLKLTIQSTTSAFKITGRLTNGAAAYDRANRPTIRYVSSPVSDTYSAAPPLYRNAARYLELIPHENSGGISTRVSDVETCAGTFIYIWVDVPAADVAQTLDIYVTELP